MAIIEFHFTTPQSIVGELIILRTKDKFSHSWVVIDDIMYNPLPIKSWKASPPTEQGNTIVFLSVTNKQKELVKLYCESWVGSYYDFLGIFGWLIGIGKLQSSKHTYCHEFCHQIMAMVTDVDPDHKMISASHLIDELSRLGGVTIKTQNGG